MPRLLLSIVVIFLVLSTTNAYSGTFAVMICRGKHIAQAQLRLQSFTTSTTNAESVRSPRDAASGLATGKRLHKPITMSFAYHFTTAGFLSHLKEGAVLDQCDIEVYDDANGKETLLYTVRLTGALVAGCDVEMRSLQASGDPIHGVDVKLGITYSKIAWVVDGRVSYEDDWR